MLQDRLSFSTRLAFGMGGIPETLKNAVWDTFVLFYFTQVIGLSGTLAGLALAIALAFNAIIDPMIGTYSDSLPGTSIGKRQRMMVASAIPFAISFTLLFSPPVWLGAGGKFAWLLVFAVICRSTISAYTIPYFALNVELSRNSVERPVLTAYRQICAAVARTLFPLLAFSVFFAASTEFPNGQLNSAAYMPFALTIAVISLLFMAWGIVGTNQRSKAISQNGAPASAHAGMSPGETFRQIMDAMKNTKNVRVFVLFNVFIFICLGVVGIYLLHLSTYYWKVGPGGIKYIAMAIAPGGIIAALCARFYVPYFDKKRQMITFILLYAAAMLIPILGPLTPYFPQPGDAAQVPTLVAMKFMGGFFYSAFLTVTGVVVGDIADELECNAGAPRQALLSSFTFFTSFAASAVINVTAGIFLDLIHFPVGQDPATVPHAVGSKLAMFSAAIIVVALAGIIYFIRKFELSTDKQQAINQELERRYSRAAEVADEEDMPSPLGMASTKLST